MKLINLKVCIRTYIHLQINFILQVYIVSQFIYFNLNVIKNSVIVYIDARTRNEVNTINILYLQL